MEGQLMYLLELRRDWKLHVDEFSLSEEITNHVHRIHDMGCCEFPAADIALKCITKEAHLLCELIESEFADASIMGACSFIRKRALKFMTYKGTEHVAASATMMGTMKEADLMLEFLEKRLAHDKKGVLFQCSILRNYAMRVMSKICPDATGDRNAGKLVPDEPDGKKYCEETNPQEGSVVNQKA
ncbi:hypothetical protein BS78_07G136500 [Paspalum vaginatum]|nr:hypothetical protein BS78_07G136500 [Paspalum vaginatum]